MASGPITSWEIDGETVETLSDFIFLGSKITADGDCSHESQMFTFFADLMQAYYSPDKTDKGVAQWLGKPEWKVRNEIMPAMKLYTGRQVMEILSLIRKTDAAGKGVGGCKTPPGELLLELVYRILE